MNIYTKNPTEKDLEKVGRDPFLIAYAYKVIERIIVTKEVSKPNRKGGNRKIPDVCNDLEITWIDDFKLYEFLDFRIN